MFSSPLFSRCSLPLSALCTGPFTSWSSLLIQWWLPPSPSLSQPSHCGPTVFTIPLRSTHARRPCFACIVALKEKLPDVALSSLKLRWPGQNYSQGHLCSIAHCIYPSPSTSLCAVVIYLGSWLLTGFWKSEAVLNELCTWYMIDRQHLIHWMKNTCRWLSIWMCWAWEWRSSLFCSVLNSSLGKEVDRVEPV